MIFEVKNGSFGYDKRQILNDISFSIKTGEVMSVLGSNGVGKTTLLKCMMGFLKWEKGQTFIDGTPINNIGSRYGSAWQKRAYRNI